MKFIKNLSTKKIFLYLLIYSIFSLSFALFLEYVLNYKPCQLCLYQRIPYLLILIFSFVGFFFPKKSLLAIYNNDFFYFKHNNFRISFRN